MKSRIGKLEGDGRTSKRLQESLGKHVKILENALKREREIPKVQSTEVQTEEKKLDVSEPMQESKAPSKRRLLQHVDRSELIFGQLNYLNRETPFFSLKPKSLHYQI